MKRSAPTMLRFPGSLTGTWGAPVMLLTMVACCCGLPGCGLRYAPENPSGADIVDERASKGATAPQADRAAPHDEATMKDDDVSLATATFGGGCFWCTEAVFQRLRGVERVVSGYMGGETKDPTYKEVCQGTTGHAEVIQIQYDPSQVRFDDLLEVFWKTHDPTTLNRQGADVGTQYRSVIFYHTDEQRTVAEKYKQKLDDADVFDDPIVTEISPASVLYAAEDYHQDYFNLNPNQGYCSFVIRPKIEKLKSVFADKLKPVDPE